MKINEILTKEELEKCKGYYGIYYDQEKIHDAITDHIEQFEIKDFYLMKISQFLEQLNYQISERY